MGGQFSLRFFPALLKDPSFYGRWLFTASGVIGFSAMLISLAGVLLFKMKQQRFLMVGAWVGYILYGFTFPYHFITHSYYHLPIIPVIAIGLIPVADLVTRQLAVLKGWLPRLVFACLLLMGTGMKMWEDRNYLGSSNYRDEIAYWQDLGQLIGHDRSIVELSGDYGFRLAYFGWVSGENWSTGADVALRDLAGQDEPDFATLFAEKTTGRDWFVITSPQEWENQTELHAYLTANYPLIDQGDSYWIFDLNP